MRGRLSRDEKWLSHDVKLQAVRSRGVAQALCLLSVGVGVGRGARMRGGCCDRVAGWMDR